MGELLSLCITERLLNLTELVVKLHLIVQNLLLYLGTLLRLNAGNLKLLVKFFELQVLNLAVVILLRCNIALQIILLGLGTLGFILCSNSIEVFLDLLTSFYLGLVSSLVLS